MEKWKDIEGYPGYQISDYGRVSGPRKMLTLVDGGQGYLKVTLSKKGHHVDKRVNRLVAEAFLDNPDDLPIVMHVDNDRSNNRVDNLRWGSYSENNSWTYACNRHPINLTNEGREKAYAVRRTPVKSINIVNGEERIFPGMHDAARSLGVSQQHIWGVLNGHRKTTGGYKFEYVDEGDFYD